MHFSLIAVQVFLPSNLNLQSTWTLFWSNGVMLNKFICTGRPFSPVLLVTQSTCLGEHSTGALAHPLPGPDHNVVSPRNFGSSFQMLSPLVFCTCPQPHQKSGVTSPLKPHSLFFTLRGPSLPSQKDLARGGLIASCSTLITRSPFRPWHAAPSPHCQMFPATLRITRT